VEDKNIKRWRKKQKKIEIINIIGKLGPKRKKFMQNLDKFGL
jgi:hypothetical protein